MKNKEIYREYCRVDDSIPIFASDWWLDIACGNGKWDVALVMRNNRIIGSMPFFIKKKFGFTLCTSPQLTRYLGPHIKSPSGKYEKKLGQEKSVMSDLIRQLPDFDFFIQTWDYRVTNWLPFYWAGFKQTSNYTYVIEDCSNIDVVWSEFNEKTRTVIRNSTKRYNLVVQESSSFFDFLKLNKLVFEAQKLKYPYDEELFSRLDEVCRIRNCRKIFLAVDESGVLHGAAYVVWDKRSMYYLSGGSDPNLRTSGAMSLCIWEAIQLASSKNLEFNFEGSMIAPIEHFFRGFGAKQKPVFQVSKIASILIRLYLFFSIRG